MKRSIPAILFVALIMGMWELVVRIWEIPEYLLPAPSALSSGFWTNLPRVAAHTGVTALEATLGFLAGTLAGVLLAIVFVRYRLIELAVYPYAIALKSVPVVAIAPLLTIWLGNGLAPKILISAIISFFPVVVNATRGLREVDTEAIDLFESFSAGWWQVFVKLRVPAAVPYVFAALRISATLAVIGAIVGEFAGADRGIGFLIMVSSYRFETVDMFVGVIAGSALGIGFFYAVTLLEPLVVPWASRTRIDV